MMKAIGEPIAFLLYKVANFLPFSLKFIPYFTHSFYWCYTMEIYKEYKEVSRNVQIQLGRERNAFC